MNDLLDLLAEEYSKLRNTYVLVCAKYDRLLETSKELNRAMTPAIRKPGITYPGDKLARLLEELENTK